MIKLHRDDPRTDKIDLGVGVYRTNSGATPVFAAIKEAERRLIEQQSLVEETGEVDADTGGRPARRYRFRRQVLQERSVAGTKLPTTRSR